MDEFLEIFKSILGPGAIIFAIVAVINWFKMFPGAQNENLKALWPGVAAILGAALSILYAWVLFGITDIKSVTIVAVVGVFVGLASAGMYKIADKTSR